MSALRQVALLALNDLRLTWRDKAAFIWMLALPVAFMWLFGQMGGGSQGPLKVTLGVDDRDGQWLARALITDLKDDQIELQEIRPGQEPPRRILIIPAGFTAGVLAAKPQELRLESQPGADQEFSLAAQVTSVRAIVRVLGRLTELPEAPKPEAYEALARRPPLVRVKVSAAGKGRPVPTGFAQSVPGTLTFFVLMMTTIYGAVFLALEKRQGMIRRQAMLPLSRGRIFAGKMAGRMLMAGAQIVIYLLAGRLLFGVSFGESPGGLLLVLFAYAAASSGLSLLLGAVVSTPEQASTVGWIVSMVLGALGGCWWPSEVMPRWLWSAAHVLPTAWAMDAFHSLISFGRGIEAVLLPSFVLLGFAALFSVLGARFLRWA
ncbi:MAG: linearmycin/streptolysin transport system permease protein [Acidobacteriota bacterium]|jgi:ABC-type multidrug transport system permease subunit|nr:linearmycin/streptolysin transport system permease protein [Acidobacteriota bacterium]